ncbi:MAG: sulfatase-like hydrolase/transferase, partial [Pirellulales bacterium]|nr:sulfatase-like hydrolase/transferase [Pirellulales bacterium]
KINSYLNSREKNRLRGMADFLDPKAPAVAREFHKAGYATAHFGKWHQGGGRDVNDAPHPRAYGFDESLVSFEGLGDRILPPGRLSRDSEKLGQGKITHVPKHKQTEIYVDRTIDFIERHRDEPFYVHLWLNDVHDAHQPRADVLAKFKKASENPFERKFFAVMDEMDRQLGRLFDRIDQLQLAQKTMIVLTSDNGPTAWARYYEAGFDPPGSTGGLRGRKWSLYEGGIREPLIVCWKGSVPAGKTDESSVMVGTDLFPSFCAIAGIDVSDIAFDGQDMSRALLGTPTKRTKPIFWEYGRDDLYLKPAAENDRSPNCAIREGNWKLLINANNTHTELYDLEADPKESTNLSQEHPEVAKRLADKLCKWRESLP